MNLSRPPDDQPPASTSVNSLTPATLPLLPAAKRTLEMIANGVRLRDVLEDLCRCVDAQVPGGVATVLLMDSDGQRLWFAAGPKFPSLLNPMLLAWPVGPSRGVSGAAAFLKRRVISPDLTGDLRWPREYRELHVSSGLRATWAEPLIAQDGRVLGTFTLYYGEPRVAGADDLELVQAAASIARVAIQLERSYAALDESERRFRLMANDAPVMIWMAGADRSPMYFNKTWLDFTGRSLEDELRSGLASITHPDDFERCRAIYVEAFDARRPLRKECRLRRHDGEYRWLLDTGVPRFLPDGTFAGYVGSCIDITEHKLAQEALSTVHRRMIDAQELERARIARELHDDIHQRLSMVAIELDTMRRAVPDAATTLRTEMETASSHIRDLGQDIQALAHRLHAAKLDLLGLAAAASSFCRETAQREQVDITFHTEHVPRDLPNELALCLYRVLQEALHNAIRHSGSRTFEITLEGGSNQVEISVRDQGVGFDADAAIRRRGLGLTSMKERVTAVGGAFAIESHPGRGTTVWARVPLAAADSGSEWRGAGA